MEQANGVQQGQAGRGRCEGGAVGINLAFVNSKGGRSVTRTRLQRVQRQSASNKPNKHEMGNAKKGL